MKLSHGASALLLEVTVAQLMASVPGLGSVVFEPP